MTTPVKREECSRPHIPSSERNIEKPYDVGLYSDTHTYIRKDDGFLGH